MLKSDIVMEVQVHTALPSIKDTLIKNYSLTYKIEYARVIGKWTESLITQETHKSKYLVLEYIYGATKQEVIVDITASVEFETAPYQGKMRKRSYKEAPQI
jgi:hypothetical protein